MTTPILLCYTDTITGEPGRILDLRKSASADLDGVTAAVQAMYDEQVGEGEEMTGGHSPRPGLHRRVPGMGPDSTTEIVGVLHTTFDEDHVLSQPGDLTVLRD